MWPHNYSLIADKCDCIIVRGTGDIKGAARIQISCITRTICITMNTNQFNTVLFIQMTLRVDVAVESHDPTSGRSCGKP